MAYEQPSLRRNAAANYISQIYVAVVTIAMAPVYLAYMGTEAYGLVGFFTMMIGWFQLLDMGLTPTLAREAARYRGGVTTLSTLRTYLRTLEMIFGAIALLGAVVVISISHVIAARWLNIQHLPLTQATYSVMLMGLTMPLRWMSELYRGLVVGFERQVWLSGYNASVATVRSIGVLLVFVFIGTSPIPFFSYQLCVAVAELVGLGIMSFSLLHRGSHPREAFSLKPLAGNISFSLTIAFLTVAWVMVTQTDKLILSRTLSLASYGVFSIAIVATNGISSLGAPLGRTVLPRFAKLAAEADDTGMYRLYDRATQITCVLVAPAVMLLVFFGRQILLAWTGKAALAAQAAAIVQLYAIGNGFAALCVLPYYIQYAKGNLHLHFVGNVLMLISLVPMFFFGAESYGAVGTGAAWATVQIVYVLAWVPVIHARYLPGHHRPWVFRQILPIVLPTLVLAFALACLIHIPLHRLQALAVLVAIGILLFVVAAACSSAARDFIATKLKLRRAASPVSWL